MGGRVEKENAAPPRVYVKAELAGWLRALLFSPLTACTWIFETVQVSNCRDFTISMNIFRVSFAVALRSDIGFQKKKVQSFL